MIKKKIKVAVIMGGKSPEHEVSIVSGREVVASLDKEKYEVLPVIISKNGRNWRLTPPQAVLSIKDPFLVRNTPKDIELSGQKEISGIDGFREVDVVFIAMHGPYGEDGTIQGLLELAGIRYTGSGVLASALGMDKIMFRKIMKSENILIPKYVVVRKGENAWQAAQRIGKPPYFVKPFNQGSSVGASIARNYKELGRSMKLAFKYSDSVLVDEYIEGVELTCGVIGNQKIVALPAVEIVAKNKFFDYESKYSESGTKEIIPARISRKNELEVRKLAIKVYKAIGASGFARVDFILRKNKLYVLEINTIPGLTPVSLLPKEAKAAGISYVELLNKIISYALEK